MREATATRKSISTENMDVGGWETFLDMTHEAPAERTIEIADFGREFSSKADFEAFLAEPVGIRIAPANSPREMPTVPVGVNGNQRWLPRDTPIKVRRFHLERLLRAGTTTFSVERVPNPELDEGHRVRNHNLPAYHIEILRDDNPKGRDWIKRMRREG